MSDTEGAIKIALAAKRWQDAVTVRQAARQSWVNAWAQCIVLVDGQFFPLFDRIEVDGEYTEYGPTKQLEWAYTKHAPDTEDGVSQRFEDCTTDPLWVAQNTAWIAWKDASRKAGHALATLTRMTRRWSAKQVTQ